MKDDLIYKLRRELRETTVGITPELGRPSIDNEALLEALELVRERKHKEALAKLVDKIVTWFVYRIMDETMYEQGKEFLDEFLRAKPSNYPLLWHLKPKLAYFLGVEPEQIEQMCNRNLKRYDELEKTKTLTKYDTQCLKDARSMEYQLIGLLKMLQKDIRGAIVAYEKSNSIEKLPETAFNLLACYSRVGDEQNASKWLKTLVYEYNLGNHTRLLAKCKTDASLDGVRDRSWFKQFVSEAEKSSSKKRK